MAGGIFDNLQSAISGYDVAPPISAYGYKAPNYKDLYALLPAIREAAKQEQASKLAERESQNQLRQQQGNYYAGNLDIARQEDTRKQHDFQNRISQEQAQTNALQQLSKAGFTPTINNISKFMGEGIKSLNPNIGTGMGVPNAIETKRYSGPMDFNTFQAMNALTKTQKENQQLTNEDSQKAYALDISQLDKQIEQANINKKLLADQMTNAQTPQEKGNIFKQMQDEDSNIRALQQKREQTNSNLIKSLVPNYQKAETPTLPTQPPPPPQEPGMVETLIKAANTSPLENPESFKSLEKPAKSFLNELNPNRPVTPVGTVLNLNPAMPLGMITQMYQSLPKSVRDRIIPSRVSR